MLSAKQLNDEFMKDARAFLDKYSGKVIEVTGRVEGYAYGGSGDKGELRLGPGINNFACADPHPMARAMPGQTVTLRGKCHPTLGVYPWTIVAVEGDPPPTVSAEQLAKEYKANEEGTAKKYRSKYLIVTGQSRMLEKDVGTEILLTPPGEKPKVTCFFGTLPQAVAERHGWLKSGQSVRVLGEWLSGDPHLQDCVVLPPTK